MRHKVIFYAESSFTLTDCHTIIKELSLLNYLLIVRGRIVGFIPFPSVLTLWEMQAVSTRIWTLVTVSISYEGNIYTTNAR